MEKKFFEIKQASGSRCPDIDALKIQEFHQKQ